MNAVTPSDTLKKLPLIIHFIMMTRGLSLWLFYGILFE